MTRARTIANCHASVEAHRVSPFPARLPRRNVEAEAVAAWRAIETLTTADASDLRDNAQALAEMRDRIDTMFERMAG